MWPSTKPNSAVSKIDSFLHLAKGWHFGEGVPPSHTTARKAKDIIERAGLSLFHVNAFPGISGEIMVTIYHENHYWEFIVEPDGVVTVIHEHNKTEISYDEKVSFEEALRRLSDFGKKIWKLSESSTSSTLIPNETNSRVSHLRTQLGGASQPFQTSALLPSNIASVPISKRTTRASRQTRLFFGSSPWMNYPLNAASINIPVAQGMNAMVTSSV